MILHEATKSLQKQNFLDPKSLQKQNFLDPNPSNYPSQYGIKRTVSIAS